MEDFEIDEAGPHAGAEAEEDTGPAARFALSRSADPDDRLENAILWKLVSERMGDRVAAQNPDQTRVAGSVTHLFGHLSDLSLWRRGPDLAYPPCGFDPRYWTYPTFLEHAGRSVEVARGEDAGALVAALHVGGRDAFVKATVQKKLAMAVDRGETFEEAMDAYLFSFLDGGPKIIVQEKVEMEWEYRVFVVAGRPVTGAGMLPSMTPYDNASTFDPKMRRFVRGDERIVSDVDATRRVRGYVAFAERVAAGLAADGAPADYVIDLCTIEGRIAIVELNPSILGRVGLYACDARRLVDATLDALGF